MDDVKPFPDVAVIGGGPAGSMAAEVLSRGGFPVTVCDRMPTPGCKFPRADIDLNGDTVCRVPFAAF